VANEAELLAELAPRFERIRLHVVGIGAAPNRWLMRKLARIGRGACTFLPSADGLLEEMQRFLERIDRPVLADVELGWPGGVPLEVYPDRLPDLHAGEFAFVSLRLAPGLPASSLTLGGRTNGGWTAHALELRELHAARTGIATRWARAKVASLLDGLHEGRSVEEIRPQVVDVGQQFGLVTPYTSLVAVERARSAAETGPLLPVAAALPPGPELPLGGTFGPLRASVGLALLAAAALLCGLGRRGRAP
jgi:Ca-activated chloride channel family protein